jgi:methylthioribose-1-phosphate isomerase
MLKNTCPDTVSLDDEGNAAVIIDQTRLPFETRLLSLKSQEEIWDAVYTLKVRGAPAIGVFAAFGLYLAAKGIDEDSYDGFYEKFKAAREYLASARPTAVNPFKTMDRMDAVVISNKGKSLGEIKALLLQEAESIRDEDISVCERIGENGLSLLRDGDGILTHCNAGRLAAVRYGTALAPVYLAHERGYKLHVFADETRPLLQGARLTAFELRERGIDVTLICDNAASALMKSGKVRAVFTGCDRVAANGDVCNKIGTSGLAVSAAYYKIPFYVCAPTSSIDMRTRRGADIVIEERDPREVTDFWYAERAAPEGIDVYNPAFDVTDAALVTAVISEHGIHKPPYEESLRRITV